MLEEEYYILFVNNEPIDFEEYDNGIYRLEKILFEKYKHPFKIVESIYRNELITNVRELDAFSEYHDGCWSPVYKLEDKKNNKLDIKIIESSQLSKYKNEINQKSLSEFCKKFKIKMENK